MTSGHWAWWGSWWPWAEANQGFLSVAALIAALLVAVVEQRRANASEKSAKESIIAAEERSAREAREADDRMFKAVLNERTSRIADYVLAAQKIISIFRAAASAEITRLEAIEGTGDHASVAGTVVGVGRDAHAALEALMAAVPADPELILASRSAIASLATSDNLGMAFGKAIAIRSLRNRLETLGAANQRLAARYDQARDEHRDDLWRHELED